MKVGIVGGTGNFGKGLAFRWAKRHEIYIGSRSPEKGERAAKDYRLELQSCGIDARFIGTSNRDAIADAEVIVLAVKFDYLMQLLTDASAQFGNKIVISPVVALRKGQVFEYVPPAEGSAAMLIQKMLPNSTVISALHTIPANKLQQPDAILEGDVPICGDNAEAKEIVVNMVREIEYLNPMDAGPLAVSKLVEPLVPLLLNIKQYGLKRNASIKFI